MTHTKGDYPFQYGEIWEHDAITFDLDPLRLIWMYEFK